MFLYIYFFFNDTATTEIYTLSLHDALPISKVMAYPRQTGVASVRRFQLLRHLHHLRHAVPVSPGPRCLQDRKSTRLNSSHGYISYAVFCLKKKKNIKYADLDHTETM